MPWLRHTDPQDWIDNYTVFKVKVAQVGYARNPATYLVEAKTMAEACDLACDLHVYRDGLIGDKTTRDDIEAVSATKLEQIRCLAGSVVHMAANKKPGE